MTLGPELYVCSSCAKEKDYLSESWHRVEISVLELPEPQYLYFCLECMSDKEDWRPGPKNGPVAACLCPDGDTGTHYPACPHHGRF